MVINSPCSDVGAALGHPAAPTHLAVARTPVLPYNLGRDPDATEAASTAASPAGPDRQLRGRVGREHHQRRLPLRRPDGCGPRGVLRGGGPPRAAPPWDAQGVADAGLRGHWGMSALARGVAPRAGTDPRPQLYVGAIQHAMN